MNNEEVNEFFKRLLSRRRQVKVGRYSLSYLDISPADSEKLYEEAERRGLLASYEFSGVKSFGTNRNDACRRLTGTRHSLAPSWMR